MRKLLLSLVVLMTFGLCGFSQTEVVTDVIEKELRDKKQVQQMVKTILNLEKVPKPDDTADALAAAICHGHSSGGVGGKRQLRIRKGI